MRPLILALVCVACGGPGRAADPPPPPCPPPCAPPPPCAAKTCVAVPATLKTDKVIYDDRCVDYCLPRCSLWSLLGGGCGCDGGCLSCGHPRTRHVLLKKILHEECPDVKCEPREAPCGPPCVPGH